jgi:hypothetical protein
MNHLEGNAPLAGVDAALSSARKRQRHPPTVAPVYRWKASQ